MVPYPAGTRSCKIKTPSRQKAIKRIVTKSYSSEASALVNSPTTGQTIIQKVAIKIKAEMKDSSSGLINSILRDFVKEVQIFIGELLS